MNRFQKWLSQPWIGPSISLVVLTVGLIGLGVNLATYYRQGARWAAEDNRSIQLQLLIEDVLTRENYRKGYVTFYTSYQQPMRLEKIEIVEPPGSDISWAKPDTPLVAETKGATSAISDQLIATSMESRGQISVLVRTPETPLRDQGTVVEIEGTLVELSGEKRTVVLKGKTVVPVQAPKVPNR
jgi:hypothetical protein